MNRSSYKTFTLPGLSWTATFWTVTSWAATLLLAQPLRADDLSTALITAQRELEIAKLEYRLYDQVEYPRQVRRLRSEIKLTKAIIESDARRLQEYRPFTKFHTGKALFVTVENVKLHRLEAELRLADLEEDLHMLRRYRCDHRRLLALKIGTARSRLASLTGAVEVW